MSKHRDQPLVAEQSLNDAAKVHAVLEDAFRCSLVYDLSPKLRDSETLGSFLDLIRLTGSRKVACESLSLAKAPIERCYSEIDVFRAACDRARADYLLAHHRAIHKQVVGGEVIKRTTITRKDGETIETESITPPDGRLAVRVLESASPEDWTPNQRHEHDLTKFSTETLLQALAKGPGEPKQ